MSAPTRHVFRSRPSAARRWETGALWVFRSSTYLVLLCGALVFGHIVFKGSHTVFTKQAPFINVPFLTEAPESLYVFEYKGEKKELGDRAFRAFKIEHPEAKDVKAESYVYSAGGIFPCIVGTVLLVVGSMIIALTLGVSAAVYLNEYAVQGRVVTAIRLAILNLAGVPSVVFGLFGLGLFVIYLDWNVSLLAGWFTLAFMVLPVVITASEESLKAVPKGFREGSLALGATKWQTIRKNVLPYALPGILTSSILGIARVAGETAPIMFTAAYVVRDKLPWQGLTSVSDFFFQGVMALPYHIYVVSSKIPQNEYTERVQYGTAFVFLMIVALIATTSIVLRNNLRNRYKW
ncbi:MAG: phosphate ABC transporter permease PstA [Undibacterium sp.]|nr:phosphate ABC transporter permease PstA [Opitutaceae bacterium]